MLHALRVAYANTGLLQELQGRLADSVSIDIIYSSKNHQCSSSFAYDLICQLRIQQNIRFVVKQIEQVCNAPFPVALLLALAAYNQRAVFLVEYFYQMFHLALINR